MTRTCPHCRRQLPHPSDSDFDRLPTRDKERILERMAVNKAVERASERVPRLARFEAGADGKVRAHRADE